MAGIDYGCLTFFAIERSRENVEKETHLEVKTEAEYKSIYESSVFSEKDVLDPPYLFQ